MKTIFFYRYFYPHDICTRYSKNYLYLLFISIYSCWYLHNSDPSSQPQLASRSRLKTSRERTSCPLCTSSTASNSRRSSPGSGVLLTTTAHWVRTKYHQPHLAATRPSRGSWSRPRPAGRKPSRPDRRGPSPGTWGCPRSASAVRRGYISSGTCRWPGYHWGCGACTAAASGTAASWSTPPRLDSSISTPTGNRCTSPTFQEQFLAEVEQADPVVAAVQ